MAATPIQHVPFLKLLNVQQTSPNSFTGRVPLQYCFGKLAHGGVVSTLAGVAAQQYLKASRKPSHIFTLDIMYLRPLSLGDVEIRIDPVKLGAKVSIVAFTALQGGKETNRGSVATIDMNSEVGMTFDTGFELLPKPVAADIPKMLANSDPNWVRWTVSSVPEKNLQMWSNFHFFSPRQGAVNPSLVDLWITHALEDERFTDDSLLLAADNFVRPLENHREGAWTTGPGVVATAAALAKADYKAENMPFLPYPWVYPTQSMKLEVKRRLPPEGIKAIFVRAQISTLINGRYDINVVIMNEQGEVLVTSSQVSFVVVDAASTSAAKL